MSKIADKYDNYKDGLDCVEDYGHAGWRGKITIKEPRLVEIIQPKKPIDLFFTFRGNESRSAFKKGRPLKPCKWCISAEVPFKAELEEVIITESIITDESEQEYYRNIRFNKHLQKKHINNALEEALGAFEKFFDQKRDKFIPNEDFNRDIYYVDIIETENPEDDITIDDLNIKKERLITLIDRELYEADRYKIIGCDVFLGDHLFGSYWSEDEAEHELMLLKKADYFRNEDYYHKYFDTLKEAEAYRKLIFINSLLGEGPQAITSTDNIIRVVKFKEERIKKYRNNIEKYLYKGRSPKDLTYKESWNLGLTKS